MTLTYQDGTKVEAIILSRTDDKIRVTIPGCEDPLELTEVNGTWVTEDCEPVRVEFAWQRKTREEILAEADCICSHELASRLIHLLRNGTDEEELQAKASVLTQDTVVVHRVV
ncbi:MAG TPA: hypothetical protein VLY04_02120 [Bryobacteraceae bacterium]|nr:hypothetical protein [Bryobacteraceae bacterium]